MTSDDLTDAVNDQFEHDLLAALNGDDDAQRRRYWDRQHEHREQDREAGHP